MPVLSPWLTCKRSSPHERSDMRDSIPDVAPLIRAMLAGETADVSLGLEADTSDGSYPPGSGAT